jgi:adenylate kinase family enzyme
LNTFNVSWITSLPWSSLPLGIRSKPREGLAYRGSVAAARRIAIVGSSGAGKSTLGRQLSERLGVPCLELDGLFHQPGWTPLPTDDFRARVAEFVAGDAWVVDGNYERARDLVLARADLVVWLRMSRAVVVRRVVRRTAGRLLTRRELWNGNRETWRAVLSRDPERSIVVWAWVMHGKYDVAYTSLQRDAPEGQRWVALRSPRDVTGFLADLAAGRSQR